MPYLPISLSFNITLKLFLPLQRAQILSAQEELGDLQQSIEDKRTEAEAVQAELSALEDDIRQARDAGDAAKVAIKEELRKAADNLARAQEELSQVTAEASRRNAECELRRNEVAQEIASLHLLSNELTARQEAIDKGESQLHTDLGQALKANTGLKQRCGDLASKVESLKLELRSEQDRCHKEIESISAESEALQTEGMFAMYVNVSCCLFSSSLLE